MKPYLVSFLALGTLAFLCHPAAGQTIINPSFETDAVPPYPGYGTITGWTGGSGINDATGPFEGRLATLRSSTQRCSRGSASIHPCRGRDRRLAEAGVDE